MKSRSLLAIALISLICGHHALAAPKHTVQRRGQLVIVTQFAANVRIQKAAMTWQTYDPVTPQQKGMETAFGCHADAVADNGTLALSCKVPLEVADGTYHLTTIYIRTDGSERNYSWLGDLPAEIEVHIKGGEAVIAPHIKSIMVRQSSSD